jgi:hypothetical protein
MRVMTHEDERRPDRCSREGRLSGIQLIEVGLGKPNSVD